MDYYYVGLFYNFVQLLGLWIQLVPLFLKYYYIILYLQDIIKAETCVFYSFSWLDPLIWVGYKRELTHEDLYATPESIKSQHLLKRFNKLVSLWCISIVASALLYYSSSVFLLTNISTLNWGGAWFCIPSSVIKVHTFSLVHL